MDILLFVDCVAFESRTKFRFSTCFDDDDDDNDDNNNNNNNKKKKKKKKK